MADYRTSAGPIPTLRLLTLRAACMAAQVMRLWTHHLMTFMPSSA